MSRGKATNNGNLYAVKRTVTGLGLFALQPIPKGKRIVEYTGPLISNEEVEKNSGKYFFGLNSKWSIDGSPRSNLARYINHSCRPNAEAINTGRRIWIWSRRNIKPGEEITYHYGKEYFEGLLNGNCKCEKCNPRRNSNGFHRTNGTRSKSRRIYSRSKAIGGI